MILIAVQAYFNYANECLSIQRRKSDFTMKMFASFDYSSSIVYNGEKKSTTGQKESNVSAAQFVNAKYCDFISAAHK